MQNTNEKKRGGGLHDIDFVTIILRLKFPHEICARRVVFVTCGVPKIVQKSGVVSQQCVSNCTDA